MSSVNTNSLRRCLGAALGAFFLVLLLGVFVPPAQAHEPVVSHEEAAIHEEAHEEAEAGPGIDEAIKTVSLQVFYFGGILLLLVTMANLLVDEKSEAFKGWSFGIMAAAIALPTLFFAASTVYLNVISETGGPVHWHADFLISVCGEEIMLKEPEGRLSNKVGTPVFHHHDDSRIHVEGVVLETEDYEVEDFFEAIGGSLSASAFTIPTEGGNITYRNGDQCSDGKAGIWNVFVYEPVSVEDGTYRSRKEPDIAHHRFGPYAAVPPGDCIVFEFGEPKDATEQLCGFYRVAEEKGEITILR